MAANISLGKLERGKTIVNYVQMITLKSRHRKKALQVTTFKIRQSTIYYAGLIGGWDKRIVDHESDVPSTIFFILFTDLGHSKHFIFIFVILYKKNKKIN